MHSARTPLGPISLLRSNYITHQTPAGQLDVRENKAISVQIQLNLPVRTELGNYTTVMYSNGLIIQNQVLHINDKNKLKFYF